MPNYDKYDGIVKFKFDGEDYAIIFEVPDLQKMTELGIELKRTGRFDMIALQKVHAAMIKKSYPDWSEIKIIKFLDTKLMDYHQEFQIAAGLSKREDIERFAKKAAENADRAMENFLSATPPSQG